jgi:hypothetical protein
MLPLPAGDWENQLAAAFFLPSLPSFQKISRLQTDGHQMERIASLFSFTAYPEESG